MIRGEGAGVSGSRPSSFRREINEAARTHNPTSDPIAYFFRTTWMEVMSLAFNSASAIDGR